MRGRVKLGYSFAGALVLAAALVFWFLWGPPRQIAGPQPARKTAHDYASYRFGPKDRVLDVGTQPLWIPTCAIAETIKRDRVLAGQLASLDLRLRMHPFLKGEDGNAFMGPERLDAMLAGDMSALVASANKRIVIVSLVHQGFAAVIAKEVRRVEDLAGKLVGYAPGSSAYFTLLKLLKATGLAGRVSLAAMDITEMPQALEQGRIAAFSSWQPNTRIILEENPGTRVLHRSLYEGFLYFTATAVEKRPKAVRFFLAAQLRAMAWMRSSWRNQLAASRWAIAEHARFSGRPLNLPPQDYAAMIRSNLLDVVPVPEVPSEELRQGGIINQKVAFLKEHGLVPAATGFERIKDSFNRSLVFEVLNLPGEYQLHKFDYDRRPTLP